LAWSQVTAATKSYSNATRGSVDTWTALASDTTTRNTSRFVLLAPISTNGNVNLQPALRSPGHYGHAFYVTTDDPIALHTSGESSI
jgi:hypothetical protein